MKTNLDLAGVSPFAVAIRHHDWDRGISLDLLQEAFEHEAQVRVLIQAALPVEVRP